MSAALAHYDAAQRALAAAVKIDEVQSVRDQAARFQLYARQAKDRNLLADAMALQFRAERRLGEMLIEAKQAGQISRGGRPRAKTDSPAEQVSATVTLLEAGIDRKLSAKAQKLAQVPEEEFAEILERAREEITAGRAVVVNPVKHLTTQDKQLQRRIREAQLALKQKSLPQKRFGVIYADPEWPFATWSDAGKDRSPENHYPTSLLPVIASRPIATIAADDCALFLWITRPLLPTGCMVMEAWGFEYVTAFTWDKVDIGLGFWNRDQSEILLLGTRGNVPCPAPGTQYPSHMVERKREHSQKPDWAYAMIEAYFPTLSKIELNARRRRPGWDAWGFEAPDEGGEIAA